MSHDQSIAVAANAICVIAFLSPAPVSAVMIAEQISLNPVVIRRVVGKLVSAGLVKSIQGVGGGYILAKEPHEIKLQDVFNGVSDKGIFKRSNKIPKANCAEGEAISEAIEKVFTRAEYAFSSVLMETTVQQLLDSSDPAKFR